MYMYSADELKGRVPDELVTAIAKSYTAYQLTKLDFENKAKSDNIIDDLRIAGLKANEAWLEYRKVNSVVTEYIKNRRLRKDVMEYIIKQYIEEQSNG